VDEVDASIEAAADLVDVPSVDSMVVSAREAEAAIKVLIPPVLFTSPLIMEILLLPVTTVARKVI
jgi:hypothetical protein